MSAADHIHPQQLKMLMSAKEIMHDYQPMDADRDLVQTHFGFQDETDHELWSRKASESTERGMTADIAQRGVEYPARLSQSKGSSGKKQVVGGHHRIAGSFVTDPDRLIPVLHDHTFGSANRDRTHGHYR